MQIKTETFRMHPHPIQPRDKSYYLHNFFQNLDVFYILVTLLMFTIEHYSQED